MKELLSAVFGMVTIASAFRTACPIIIAAMGGSFSQRTGTFNMAYECFMLCGAFFAAWGARHFASSWMGMLCAVAAGLLLALVFGLLVFVLDANPLVISIALNMGAWAMTTLLMQLSFGTRGYYIDKSIINYPVIHMPALENVKFLDVVINNNIGLVYFAYVLIVIGWIVMYKTPFGLRLRGVGINATAARTAGVNVNGTRWTTLIIMGVCTGLAGSYLPLSGLNMFSENMASGRGFLAFAAILVGKGNPFHVSMVAFLFAYTEALTTVLTAFELPTQLVLMLPYAAVVITLFIAGMKSFTGKPHIS